MPFFGGRFFLAILTILDDCLQIKGQQPRKQQVECLFLTGDFFLAILTILDNCLQINGQQPRKQQAGSPQGCFRGGFQGDCF